ncbi:DUF6171 family protein [Paenibacillus sp. CAU 1782]
MEKQYGYRDECKGCDNRYQVSSADIDRMLAAPMFSRSDVCVSDAEYDARLQACRSCPRLLDGETCSACGCYVRVAAKLKSKSCPLPGGGLWPAAAVEAVSG